MPKSTTNQDKIGTLADFRAPWETESGAEVEVDKPTLKRLLFNLKTGEAKAKDAEADVKVELAEATTALATAKDEAASANGPEAQKKIDKLETKVSELTKERDDLVSSKEQADLRATVLGDLDPKYAKYVTGETQEELEESLKAVREDFNLSEDDPAEEEVEDARGRTSPRPRVNLGNPADKGGKGGEVEIDFDKATSEMLGGGNPFR